MLYLQLMVKTDMLEIVVRGHFLSWMSKIMSSRRGTFLQAWCLLIVEHKLQRMSKTSSLDLKKKIIINSI